MKQTKRVERYVKIRTLKSTDESAKEEKREKKMFFNGGFRLLLLFLLLGFSTSATISDGIFKSHEHNNGRSLLQANTGCSANFESANYTILTSRCKGPKYTAEVCCAAFKDFACPYVEQINNLKSDCANTMFSYINLYGKYPPGLFGYMCTEGKEGLWCPAPSPESANNGTQKSTALIAFPRSSGIMIAAGFTLFLAYI